MAKRKETISKLKKKADTLYSEYIRKRDTNEIGFITCFTCDRILEYKEAQNMHYIPRRHLATRWLDLNCHAGCYRCNVILKGNYDEYALRLIKKYGDTIDILSYLSKLKNTTVQMKIQDYRDLVEDIKDKIKYLDNRWSM